jgi:hypothetical protein
MAKVRFEPILNISSRVTGTPMAEIKEISARLKAESNVQPAVPIAELRNDLSHSSDRTRE